MKNLKYYFLILSVFSAFTLYGQTDSTKIREKAANDTLVKLLYSQNEVLRQLADSLGKAEIFKNREKQIFSQQMSLIANISKVTYKVDDYFKKEIDTADINSNLNEIENQYSIASQGIGNDSNKIVTERNLSTTSLLLKGLQIRLDHWKSKITNYLENLEGFRRTIDSLQTDTILFKFAKDSVLFTQYFNKLIEVSRELNPIDSNLTDIIKEMHDRLNSINDITSRITATKQEIVEKRKFGSQNIFKRDSPDIWNTSSEDNIFNESIKYSYDKGSLLFEYYFVNNLWRVIILLTGFIFITILIYRTRKKYRALEIKNTSREIDLILKYPLIISAFISLIFFEFIFPHPPVIFQGVIWILSALLLTVILWNYFTGIQRTYWLYLFIVFTVILISDLILKESITERLFLLLIALSGIGAGILAIKKSIFNVRNKTAKILLLSVSVLLLSTSLISNVFGRFNLTKTLLTVSFFILISGYLLYWGMILTIELLDIFAETYDSGVSDNFRIKLERLKTHTPVYLKFFFFFGWFIMLARNFYIYEYFMDGLVIFIEEERTVGNFTFTFEKILIFVFIIFLSTILSRIISFFADSSDIVKLRRENKAGLSNWMLLIRIGIMAGGIILAFAATGIPIDKMVIIIGSLGVGIGFGLQTLVNNLVSGLLLAFEKPFQIGDFIDIGDNSGRIKEIGIRSSKISTSDGADIIIPNGDLLSKHVTNWTMRNTLRRSEMVLSFNSPDNIGETRKTLQEILDGNENILKNMPSEVLLNNFTESSAEYKLSFWTDIDKANEVKSDIMLSVRERLHGEGEDKAQDIIDVKK